MTILYLACLNNDPVIQYLLGPKCNPVGGEPPTYTHPVIKTTLKILKQPQRSIEGASSQAFLSEKWVDNIGGRDFLYTNFERTLQCLILHFQNSSTGQYIGVITDLLFHQTRHVLYARNIQELRCCWYSGYISGYIIICCHEQKIGVFL